MTESYDPKLLKMLKDSTNEDSPKLENICTELARKLVFESNLGVKSVNPDAMAFAIWMAVEQAYKLGAIFGVHSTMSAITLLQSGDKKTDERQNQADAKPGV